MKSVSRVRLFVTPWTVAHQAPLSMGFSRQEYWSGLPFPSPEDLPDPGIEPRSPALQADALTWGGRPIIMTSLFKLLIAYMGLFLSFFFLASPFCFGKDYWKGHREFQVPLLFCFSSSLGEAPRGGFLQEALSVYCACVCFKSSFVSENSLSSSASGNALGGFEGKVGNSWALGGTNGGGSDLTLNQKVMHKFLKVCVEEEGPR